MPAQKEKSEERRKRIFSISHSRWKHKQTLQLCPRMNERLLCWNPFGMETTSTQIIVTFWGERTFDRTKCCKHSHNSLLPAKIAMILTFRWVRTFQWKGVYAVCLFCSGAVFIFFDNKPGNYSVMIKIYSKTRWMLLCVRACVCVWDGDRRNCTYRKKNRYTHEMKKDQMRCHAH